MLTGISDNLVMRNNDLIGTEGARAIRFFHGKFIRDPVTGEEIYVVGSPYMNGKKAIWSKFGDTVVDKRFVPGRRDTQTMKQFLDGVLGKADTALLNEAMPWMAEYDNSPSKFDFEKSDAELNRIAKERGLKFFELLGLVKDEARDLDRAVRKHYPLGEDSNLIHAGLGKDNAFQLVRGEHGGASFAMIPDKRAALWGNTYLSLLMPQYNDTLWFMGYHPGFDEIYERDSKGKYKTPAAFYNAMILDNFFHSKLYNSFSDADKRKYFAHIRTFDDLVDAMLKFEAENHDKIRAEAFKNFVTNALDQYENGDYWMGEIKHSQPYLYAFDPDAKSELDPEMVDDALIDKFVEGLLQIAGGVTDPDDTDNFDNMFAGMIKLEGHMLIDNLKRARGEATLQADGPVEGIAVSMVPLNKAAITVDITQKYGPAYVKARREGARARKAWKESGFEAVFGPIDNLISDERMKKVYKGVYADTCNKVSNYLRQQNITKGITRGPGND